MKIMMKTLKIFFLFFLLAGNKMPVCADLVTYDFSTETLSDAPNGYLGGWFEPQLNFDQWYANDDYANISDGKLVVESQSGRRAAAVLLAPELFVDGAGTYRVDFDVAGFSFDNGATDPGGDFGFVSVWSGSGYDLSSSSGNALFVDKEKSLITSSGTATASEIAGFEFTSTGSYSLDFEYDGSSAIGLFLGAETQGWPFPTSTFSNISVAVPEPAVMSLIALFGLVMLVFKRIKNI